MSTTTGGKSTITGSDASFFSSTVSTVWGTGAANTSWGSTSSVPVGRVDDCGILSPLRNVDHAVDVRHCRLPPLRGIGEHERTAAGIDDASARSALPDVNQKNVVALTSTCIVISSVRNACLESEYGHTSPSQHARRTPPALVPPAAARMDMLTHDTESAMHAAMTERFAMSRRYEWRNLFLRSGQMKRDVIATLITLQKYNSQ